MSGLRWFLFTLALCFGLVWAEQAEEHAPENPVVEDVQVAEVIEAAAVKVDEVVELDDSAESTESAAVYYPKPERKDLTPVDGVVDVYVIPIEDAISKPNLFILRRGLKQAIENDIEMVILDMDTPGGRVDVCLEMMEMLDRFEGVTATYVNEDAISAGSFIAAATDEIYFSPRGKIGASAVITGTGEDIGETAKQKIESYLRAHIRIISDEDPLRGKVIRAMLETDYELKIGDEVIKPAGELLTLTAKEAIKEYGDPPRPLLGEGIYEDVETLLAERVGDAELRIKRYELSGAEVLGKWINAITPLLMALGVACIYIEFQSPGFGIFGVLGLCAFGVLFGGFYVAGLAGYELYAIFVLGFLLVIAELLLMPGALFLSIPGLAMMLGSLIWGMVDYWPKGTGELTLDSFVDPFVNVVFGLALSIVGVLVLYRLIKGSPLESRLVLSESSGGASREDEQVAGENSLPDVGLTGTTVTKLFPSGRVELGGKRYEARCAVGMIDRGVKVRVVRYEDFDVIVEEVKS